MRKNAALYKVMAVSVVFCMIIAVVMILRTFFKDVSQEQPVSSMTAESTSEAVEDAFVKIEIPEELLTDVPKTKPDDVVDITLNFMGDCTLGTYCGEFTEKRFNETAERVEPEYFFEGVRSVLDDGTFNITNCEGVFTDNPLEEVYKDYSPAFWFKSPAKNAKVFSVNNIEVVGIANNHIGDYGDEGIYDTKAALEKNGIRWSDSSKRV